MLGEEQYVVKIACDYLCSEVEREASIAYQRKQVYQNEVNNSQHTKWAFHATHHEPVIVSAYSWTQTEAGCRYISAYRGIINATVTSQFLSPRS